MVIRAPLDLVRAATGGSPDVRAPLVYTRAATGGVPDIRAPLVGLRATTGGQPRVRAPLAEVRAATGGQPHVRASLVILRALIPEPPELPVATDVFPVLRGLQWDRKKQPEFKTTIRGVASGRETRTAFMAYPWWNFEFSYDYLPDNNTGTSGYSDLRTLEGFFLQMQGSFKAWLYQDPDDYHVVGGAIGTGDGVTTQLPFVRSLGGFSEPVGQIDLSTLATFASTAVNTGTSQINIPNHGFTTGQSPPVFVSNPGTLPTGLSASTPYWIIAVDADHIQFATTLPRALASDAISLSAAGSGTNTLTKGWAIYETTAETDAVPGTGPYTVTVTHAATFAADGGVAISGTALTKVSGAPAANQYSVDATTGVYTFNSAQASASAVITYTWRATGVTLTLPNQAVFSPAAPSGNVLTADFDFYFVCRFTDDKAEFNQFVSKLWDLQKLDFRSVIQ
jgi:hypothetical protein